MSENNPYSQVFIDGANFWQACCGPNGLAITPDYAKLGLWLVQNFNATRINYYTAVKTDENQKQSLRPLLDWLSYHGYNVVEKPARPKGLDEHGRQQYKGNMDIEIAIDCARLMVNTNIRRVILFSGDSDFEAVVRFMQEYGTHVTVVSTRETQPSMVAESLRKVADHYIDIAQIADHISKQEGEKENVVSVK